MKLWQKIFLLALALVIIAVNVSSLALLSNNHRLAIEREQQSALVQHNYLDTELINTIVYRQLIERKISLTDDEALQAAIEVLDRQQSNTSMGISLFQDGSLVTYVNREGIVTNTDLLGQEDYSSVIEERDGTTYLYIVSTTTLGEQSYQLVTSFDISSTFKLFHMDYEQIRFIGIVSALIVAGILLLLVRGLLNPLRNLSTTTRLIAGGDLDKRAEVKGHDEVAEVAHSLNIMADSIESNVTALEDLAESRRVFISNLAHEMKTPLTSILGFADILRVKREVPEEERVEYANVIVSETKRLQELSGKLMELLSVGKLQTTPETVEIHDFASELVTILRPVVNSHSIELRTELPEEPYYIRVDKELMKSFVFNLVDNSIKASAPSKTIRLIFMVVKGVKDSGMAARGVKSSEDGKTVDEDAKDGGAAAGRPVSAGMDADVQTTKAAKGTEATKDGEGTGDKKSIDEFVKIIVVDEGVGIPAEEIPLIVEPFYMLDKARTRKHGGAGLGLALCSEIARAHGSRLEIKSIKGRGTAASILLRKEEGDGED